MRAEWEGCHAHRAAGRLKGLREGRDIGRSGSYLGKLTRGHLGSWGLVENSPDLVLFWVVWQLLRDYLPKMLLCQESCMDNEQEKGPENLQLSREVGRS